MEEEADHLKAQSLAAIASTDEEKSFIKPFVDLDNQAKLFETMDGNQQEDKMQKKESESE